MPAISRGQPILGCVWRKAGKRVGPPRPENRSSRPKPGFSLLESPRVPSIHEVCREIRQTAPKCLIESGERTGVLNNRELTGRRSNNPAPFAGLPPHRAATVTCHLLTSIWRRPIIMLRRFVDRQSSCLAGGKKQ